MFVPLPAHYVVQGHQTVWRHYSWRPYVTKLIIPKYTLSALRVGALSWDLGRVPSLGTILIRWAMKQKEGWVGGGGKVEAMQILGELYIGHRVCTSWCPYYRHGLKCYFCPHTLGYGWTSTQRSVTTQTLCAVLILFSFCVRF